MRQPHGRQTDAVVPAIFGVTRQGIRKSGRFRPAGNGLLPGFFCPLRLRGQYQLRIPLYSITDWHRSSISDSHPFDQPGT
nr:hypothetical protein [Shigella sonnei]